MACITHAHMCGLHGRGRTALRGRVCRRAPQQQHGSACRAHKNSTKLEEPASPFLVHSSSRPLTWRKQHGAPSSEGHSSEHAGCLAPSPSPQGVFIKRHKATKENGMGFFGPEDFSVGEIVTIYGRTFYLLDADGFTREFYAARGKEQGPPGGYPDDPIDTYRSTFGANKGRTGSGEARSCGGGEGEGAACSTARGMQQWGEPSYSSSSSRGVRSHACTRARERAPLSCTGPVAAAA